MGGGRKIQHPLLVLIFTSTYFRGDRNDRISRVHIFADSPSKCCKNLKNCLKMTEFSKITFVQRTVKIANSFLQSVSNQFHVIILSLPM